MSYFPARVPPACLFLVQFYHVFFFSLSSKGNSSRQDLFLLFLKGFSRKPRSERVPAQITGIKEEYLSKYMKAAGWFSLSLVCPRDGLAGVKGHTRLFWQEKLPWWRVGDKINVSNLRLAAAQAKVPLRGPWHHTKCIGIKVTDDTDFIRLIKTAAHQWVSPGQKHLTVGMFASSCPSPRAAKKSLFTDESDAGRLEKLFD